MSFGWTLLQQNYYIRADFHDGYTVYITDFKSLWKERMDRNQFKVELKARLQVDSPMEKLIPFIVKLIDASDSSVKYEVKVDSGLLLDCTGKLGTLPLRWKFECQPVLDSQELVEILINPLLKVSLAYQQRQETYKDMMKKMQERIEMMQTMFDLHGIQSGLAPFTLPSVEWTDPTCSIASLSDALAFVSKPIPRIETKEEVKVEPQPVVEPKIDIDEKKRRREELLKQSQQKQPAKKKRAF